MKNGSLLSRTIATLLVMAIGGGIFMYGDIQSIKTDITNIKADMARIVRQLNDRDMVGR